MVRFRKNVYWPVFLFLLVQDSVVTEMFWMLGLTAVALHLCFFNKGKLMIPFPEYTILLLFLVWGTFQGMLANIFGSMELKDIVRDIYYYGTPVLFIYLGAEYAREKINIYHVLNAFILYSAFSCIRNVLDIVQNIGDLMSVVTVHKWRQIAGNGSVVMSVALAVQLSGIIPHEYRLLKGISFAAFAITGAYSLMTLSRTVLLMAVVLYACLLFNGKNITEYIKMAGKLCLISAVLIAVAGVALPPTIIDSFAGKFLNSLSEISASNDWSSPAQVEMNWRGYEAHMALEQWKASPFWERFVGGGFGDRIFVGEYAYTLLHQVVDGEPADSIAVLHNGYATQLIKMGVLGVVAYLGFYFSLLRRAIRNIRCTGSVEGYVLLAVTVACAVLTYFLNGLFRDYCVYPFMILIGYAGYAVYYQTEKKDCVEKNAQ